MAVEEDVDRQPRLHGLARPAQQGVHHLLPGELRTGDRQPAAFPAGQRPRQAEQQRERRGERDRVDGAAPDQVRGGADGHGGAGEHEGAREPMRWPGVDAGPRRGAHPAYTTPRNIAAIAALITACATGATRVAVRVRTATVVSGSATGTRLRSVQVHARHTK